MYEKLILKNGVRIIMEHNPNVHSVAAGVWVVSGSRHEPAALSGISHFIEHMVFKGTKVRTASQIAAEMDSIGGGINAFTGKEFTSFYVRTLGEHLPAGLDILFDLFFNATFSEQDVKSERGVIFEEISMYEDTPDDLVSERLFSRVFSGSPLSRPVLGKRSTLSRITGSRMREYVKRSYLPQNTLIALSGNFSPSDIDFVKSAFEPMSATGTLLSDEAVYARTFTVKKKNIEQNHLCLAFPGIASNAPSRYAVGILSAILGGNMSSRLFQTIREDLGLCYSIYSYAVSYNDTGLLSVNTALSKLTEAQALSMILKEIDRFVKDGPTEDEIARAKAQIKASVLLSLESTSARMNAIARGELTSGTYLDSDEIIRRYGAVTRDDIMESARKILTRENLSLSAVGQVHPAKYYENLIHS